ncbi:MAG: MEDS domain-containing protein [Rhodospirillaceae bacterium]|nr:MEDS domain-containing protein [Rhodospirillaceae bacterium]
MTTRLEQQLDGLRHGDHVCPIHERLPELLAVAVPFIRDGLARGERCIYAADDSTTTEAIAALGKSEAARAQNAGALHFIDKRATYVPSGRFDPDAMIGFLDRAETEALSQGFSGLRYAGDMTWALETEIEAERLISYEARLNHFVSGRRVVILCHYCRTRFDPALLHDILRAHPTIIMGEDVWSNPYFEPPELLLNPEKEVALEFKRRRVDWWIERLRSVMAAEQERIRTEAALREARDALLRISRATTMGEIAASIAHEINQPLTAMVTHAAAGQRWLAGNPPNLDEVRGILDQISRDGHRMSEIIQRIRRLLEKRETEFTQIDVNGLVGEVLKLVGQELRDNKIIVRTNLDMNAAPIMGDRVQLQQCLLNLIVNAVEAMTDVPEVARRLSVNTATEGGEVVIAVEDTGPGISLKNADQLFDPFFTTKKGGIGLGLSICRSVIESHGGQIVMKSAVPRGAIFQLRLPTIAPKPQ